ncbi:hypothetical protein SH1V18_34460 [Vallitalea longa]|uniref:Uncharacterized protein n=1 Tax=Vallitalea longa TaxID=2936439 RepID=A0A9W5YE18_9FIRM|nr:small ribosomal subunit Rsm22 family protein [Vallitalea longa]GKX30966.1 hypothetical protein SH1V18_34460 [Vallitalea longa]
MFVDKLDQCLVMEENDLKSTLTEFSQNRIIPLYIEKGILNYIFQKNGISFMSNGRLDDLLIHLPDEVTDKIIHDVKAMFFSGGKINYKNFYESYLFYYFEANIFKVWKPLLDIQLSNLLKNELIILDIGTGPGSIPVGIIEYYKLLSSRYPDIDFSIVIDIIEAEEDFIKIAEHMVSEVIDPSITNLDIVLRKRVNQVLDYEFDYTILDTYDLITMSNFLTVNERENVAKGSEILKKLSDHLKEDGAIVVIEPGDTENGKLMKDIRNTISDGTNINVFAPCTGVWDQKKTYNCNCYSPTRAYWEIPRLHRFLYNKGLSKAGREQLPFQYIVYRLDGFTKYNIIKNRQHYIQLKDLHKYINMKVNVKANIRSVIERKFSNQWAVLLCDGSCTFEKRNSEIKTVIKDDFLGEIGLTLPIIAGERITLKNVLVKSTNYGFELEVTKESIINIEY